MIDKTLNKHAVSPRANAMSRDHARSYGHRKNNIVLVLFIQFTFEIHGH